jgi:putative sterol carrier protein
MAKTAKEIFENKAPSMLEKHADKLKGINAAFRFDISGEGGGVWTMDLKSEPFAVKAGDDSDVDCTITVSHDDFQKLVDNFGIAMQLFTTGKLKVDNPLAAMKLQKILPLLAS